MRHKSLFGGFVLWLVIGIPADAQEPRNSDQADKGEDVKTSAKTDETDPMERQQAVLYLADGRKLWGHVVDRGMLGIRWQLIDGTVLNIPAQQIARVVPIPAGVTPHIHVAKDKTKTVLPLGALSWADAVVGFRCGNPGMFTPPNTPLNAIGAPNFVRDGDGSSFVLGHGGQLIVAFTNNGLVDVPGPDLIVVEIGGRVEPVKVAISANGRFWIDVGGTGGGPAGWIDIGKSKLVRRNQQYHFVMIRDARRGLSNDTRYPGADIDAIGAVGSVAMHILVPRDRVTEI